MHVMGRLACWLSGVVQMHVMGRLAGVLVWCLCM